MDDPERRGKTKLTPEMVRLIREWHEEYKKAQQYSIKGIAQKMDVSYECIRGIIVGRRRGKV